MPRPRRVIPAVDWKVYIPIDLAAKVDVLLVDPLTGRTEFGARSAYIERLVRQDLANLFAAKDGTKGQ
jgi:hypothetical protein